MKVMVLVKATEESENGVIPSTSELEAMGRYNEELVKAGVILDGDGLRPSSKGARLSFEDDGKVTVTDGPFAETTELLAGYWVWQVETFDEAVEWARRIPFGGGQTVEIRPFHEAEDFGEEFTPELREQEAELRRRTSRG